MADHVGQVIRTWERARPDWDFGGMALFARISRIERLIEVRRLDVLRPHGLATDDVDILASLWRHHPTGQRPRDLRRTMLVGSGTLTPRLDRLESGGWLLRQQDPDDGRGRILVLTEAGHARVPILVEQLLTVENHVLESIPRGALERLTHDLDGVLQPLEP